MKVGYSKTFPNTANGQWIKVWAEDEFTGSSMEDARRVWYDIKRGVESFYYESTKADEKQTGMVTTTLQRDERALQELGRQVDNEKRITLEEQIKSCNEIKVLESYKFIVKGKPELEQVYNNRLKELT